MLGGSEITGLEIELKSQFLSEFDQETEQVAICSLSLSFSPMVKREEVPNLLNMRYELRLALKC